MKKIQIDGDYIKLDQLLKLSDIAQSGGHAKMMIISGDIKVNNQTVYERGKKIRSGDVVVFEEEIIQVM